MKFRTIPLALLLAVPLTGAASAQSALTTTKPVEPIQLKPASNAPITLHSADEDSKAVYLDIGKVAGLHVLFDEDYQPRKVQVDLDKVSLNEALRIAGIATGSFYIPITPDTIFVAANTRVKHNDFDERSVETFYMRNSTQQADANEIVTALRNVLMPEDKVYLVASKDAIVMMAPVAELVLARKLLNDLDLTKASYRLTYTVTEMDGSKQVSSQQFSALAVAGQSTVIKQGSKVPIATGSYSGGDHPQASAVQTQFTYIDTGMNFSSVLTPAGNGAELKASIERSSVAPEVSGVGPQDPIIVNSNLSGIFELSPGKAVRIGSLDIAGTTRRLDIDATLEVLN